METHTTEALQQAVDDDITDSPSKNVARKPFPVAQLVILNLILFSEPVTSTVIYPFVNQFVQDTGITRGDAKKTGYYAGLIESVFFLSEFLCVYHWGTLSDRIGRRPVLLLGPLGLSFAMTSFGLATNFWMLFVSRCAQGVFNGNIGVAKSAIMEITDPADVPSALSWYPAVWSAGVTIGPLIGGVTAKSALRWPTTIGRFGLFYNHPYFLPCAIAGIIAFCTFLYAYYCLHESLPSLIERKTGGMPMSDSYEDGSTTPLLDANISIAGYSATSGGDDNCKVPETSNPSNSEGHETADKIPAPPLRSLLTRSLLIPLANLAFLSFLDQAHQVLLPLMLSTSIPLGGLGFTPFTIGIIMGTWGITNAIFQVVVFSRVVKWLGLRRAFIATFACFLSTFSAYPLMSYLAKRSGRVSSEVWVVLFIQLFLYFFAYMAYACCQIFIFDAAPPESLGAVNGLAQMTSAILRTIAPTFASSLFSVSLERNLLDGYLVYFALVGIVLVGSSISFLLPRSQRARAR